ncbi:MAG: protein translocase subunit SecF [Chloroflexi bacterium]|uniref:protein translocase subunit SecF n=1 Tax=Candidatus Flexifilum breve TaxID=3140694 RepID=UPI003135F52B|nr:protein translocase subunit SecF [Chloroflexota bacterium]
MFSLVQKRRLFFLISMAVIIPGVLIMLYSLFTTGSLFRLSNDFVGGSIYELRFTEAGADETAIRDVFQQFGNTDISIQSLGATDEHRWSVRANFQDEEVQTNILNALEAITPLDRASLRVEQVSGTVGQEVSQSAFLAVIVASVIVTGFVVIAFRQVPNAFRYGVCSIIAMVHDVLVVSGIMSLAGLLFGWEVDALFLTAVLTVLAYSVQDTIVMFDRIRENIPKHLGEPYEVIVNRSILETIHRSLATQLNAFFIMIAILLFGGESIKQFIAILFVGLLTGTYSSIFIAVPLLVAWEKGEIAFINQPKKDLTPLEGEA